MIIFDMNELNLFNKKSKLIQTLGINHKFRNKLNEKC